MGEGQQLEMKQRTKRAFLQCSYALVAFAVLFGVSQRQEDDADTLPQQQNTQSAWAKFRQFAIDVVSSSNCNAFFAMVVLTNSIYLGVQLEYHSVAQDAKADGVFLAVHLCYALIFTLEAMQRKRLSCMFALGFNPLPKNG